MINVIFWIIDNSDLCKNIAASTTVCQYFKKKKIANSDHISLRKLKRLFNENVEAIAAYNNGLAWAVNNINTKLWAKFDGNCLKHEKLTFNLK